MQKFKHTQGQKCVISALNRILNKYQQPLDHKVIVFNRVNSAFTEGASPAKGYAIGMRDIAFFKKNGGLSHELSSNTL